MGFIERAMKRTNRNLFVVVILIFLLVVGFSLHNRRMIAGVIQKPVAVTSDELRGLQASGDWSNRLVDLSEAIDGYSEPLMVDEYRFHGIRKAMYEYGLVKIDGSYMFFKADSGAIRKDELRFRGNLTGMDAMMEAYFKESPDIGNSPNYPFMLDTTRDFYIGASMMLLIFALLVAWFLVVAYRLVSRVLNPKKHIIYKRLVRQGDPEEIIRQFEDELDRGEYEVIRNYIVTGHWIVKCERFSLKIAKNYFEPGSSYYLDNVF